MCLTLREECIRTEMREIKQERIMERTTNNVRDLLLERFMQAKWFREYDRFRLRQFQHRIKDQSSIVIRRSVVFKQVTH